MIEGKKTEALGDIRVLDLSDQKGQLCGKFLADLGAEVIKVEPPEGDPARQIGPFFHNIVDKEKSLLWFGCNSNKKSITLNVADSQGCDILKQLILHTDIVIESFTPGYLPDLGLGFNNLRIENPGVVLTSISPFGQTGPFANYKAYDLTVVGMSGFIFTCGEADRPPVRISIEQACVAAGVQAATASLLALYSSRLTGQGQHVDIAIRECLPGGGFETFFWETEGYIGERLGVRRRRASVYIRDLWPCKDGYIGYRLMTGPLGAPTINSLVKWMNSEGMAGELNDVKWEQIDMTQVTQEQMERWEKLIIPFLMKHTKGEIYEVALAKEMLMAPSFNVKELLKYEQLCERGFWSPVVYPELESKIIHPGAFCKMSESPLEPPRRAPLIGENNQEIYADELGFSDQEIQSLKDQRII